jgi:hypothetical protein
MDYVDGLGLAAVPLIVSLSYFYWRYATGKRVSLPHPPGPRGVPLLGNIRDIPTEYEWLTYNEYSKRYGALLSWQFTLRLTQKLLDRRCHVL